MEPVNTMGQRYKAVKALVDYWVMYLPRVSVPTIMAIISHESSFNPVAENSGHWGLMQIAPATAVDVIRELRKVKNPTIDATIDRYGPLNPHTLLEPDLNIMLGIGYLNILSKAFDNDSDLVIAAYNRGSEGVRRLLSSVGREGIAGLEYVRHVNAIKRQLESVV